MDLHPWRDTELQATGSSPAVPLLEKAATEAQLPLPPETIVIADYGSSEGRNSLNPLGAAVRVLRSRIGSDRAISVVHTDLPGNDFTALFCVLSAEKRVSAASAAQ